MQGRPGEGHIDIAREVLAQRGITAEDDADFYRQMFRLRFVRVLEHDDNTVEVEHGHGPAMTAAQKLVIEGFRREGRKINVNKRSI
jgi:hypothetical protein